MKVFTHIPYNWGEIHTQETQGSIHSFGSIYTAFDQNILSFENSLF